MPKCSGTCVCTCQQEQRASVEHIAKTGLMQQACCLSAASDILEHGPDEKAVVLFTAFLCQRLMEMSKEERAAMVMQRLWRRRGQHKPGG